jgi:hypothetical protein
MFPEEAFKKIVEMIFIDYKFEFPITFAMVGMKGFLVWKFELAMAIGELKTTAKFESTVLAGKAKSLRFPINMMIVDSRGEAIHILFKAPSEINKVTRCQVEQPPPTDPINWPKA